MAKKRNKYTDEFKRDAVRLMRNRGERTVAQDRDLHPNDLRSAIERIDGESREASSKG